jgi:hypothetical protein
MKGLKRSFMMFVVRVIRSRMAYGCSENLSARLHSVDQGAVEILKLVLRK